MMHVQGKSQNLSAHEPMIWLAWLLIAACTTGGCHRLTPTKTVKTEHTHVQQGLASWYGEQFQGKLTASGESFNKNSLTAAHRSLPFGTRVRVTNKKNGKSVIVKINDRGPFSGNRIIDLSEAAAKALGMIEEGIARVKLEVLR